MIFRDIETINYVNKEKSLIGFYATCDEYGRIPMCVNIVDTEDLHTTIVDGNEIPLEVYCLKQNIGEYTEPKKVISIPQAITSVQFKFLLIEKELVNVVEEFISTDIKAKVYYENIQTVERTSPMLNTILESIGMIQTDIDDFFIKAKAIVA